jgi:hypothetical protein
VEVTIEPAQGLSIIRCVQFIKMCGYGSSDRDNHNYAIALPRDPCSASLIIGPD